MSYHLFLDDSRQPKNVTWLDLPPYHWVVVKSYETNCVVISGGVDEGAKIVVLGVQKLDPTQKVRVVSSLSF